MTASPNADRAALALRQAHERRTPCTAPGAQVTDLTMTDAYRAQRINVSLRTHTRREDRPPVRLTGYKAMTTGAFGDVVNVATLLTDMAVLEYAEAPSDHLVHPRAVGALAFVLRDDLDGPGVTAADVINATSFVAPVIEVLDSRIADWGGDERDRVADNGHGAFFVIGSSVRSPVGLDLMLTGMVLRRNGRVAATGAGAACAGSPASAVAAAANLLTSLGIATTAGAVMLSCPFAAPVPVAPGDALEVAFGHIGSTSVRLSPNTPQNGAYP